MEKVKIMIVEDESIVAKDIENMLKRVGYDVPAVVASGEKAIEKAQDDWQAYFHVQLRYWWE